MKKLLHFYQNFTEICSKGSNQKYADLILDDGYGPEQVPAIIWTKVSLVYRRS